MKKKVRYEMILLGCIGFCLYLVYDLNQSYLHQKWLQPCFLLGSSCVCISWIGMTIIGDKHVYSMFIQAVFLILAIVFAVLLVYTLFFAIPFKDTYVDESFKYVCRVGVYALCRHPGVLFLFGFTLFMSLALGSSLLLKGCFIFNICNIIYVVLQDKYFFPKCFDDYQDYKTKIPFLIPSRKSYYECVNSIGDLHKK